MAQRTIPSSLSSTVVREAQYLLPGLGERLAQTVLKTYTESRKHRELTFSEVSTPSSTHEQSFSVASTNDGSANGDGHMSTNANAITKRSRKTHHDKLDHNQVNTQPQPPQHQPTQDNIVPVQCVSPSSNATTPTSTVARPKESPSPSNQITSNNEVERKADRHRLKRNRNQQTHNACLCC